MTHNYSVDNSMRSFTAANKDLWFDFQPRQIKKILIEQATNPMKIHLNGLLSIIINQAKGCQPYWLVSRSSPYCDVIRSYVPNSEFIVPHRNPLYIKIYTAAVALIKFCSMIITRDIVHAHYDGVKYGDVLYDTYLKKYNLATIRRPDLKLLRIIYDCFSQHSKYKILIQRHGFDTVLSSTSIFTRTALRYGCEVFIRDGHEELTFQLARSMPDIYNYAFRPRKDDIDKLVGLDEEMFTTVYQSVLNNHISEDSKYFSAKDAYASGNKIFTSRDDFNAHYHLDSGKKNVFIMLHAFNDLPHSLFEWMLFKDYYDWFLQTLRFAHSFKKVNWIFKQHPSIRYYRTRDVDFDTFFSKLPPHITYISEEDQIDTRSLIACADLVVTCIGSAGFELPALGGIQALIAGDTFYNGLDFTHEPKTINEYFDTLRSVSEMKKLTKEQQKRAQAAFIYIYRLTKVPLTACPPLSVDQQRESQMDRWYWDEVQKLYTTQRQQILSEIKKYIGLVSDPDFRKLTNAHHYIGNEK